MTGRSVENAFLPRLEFAYVFIIENIADILEEDRSYRS